MVMINIDSKVYHQWKKFYKTQDTLEYPSLKNFTEKKMLELISQRKSGSRLGKEKAQQFVEGVD